MDKLPVRAMDKPGEKPLDNPAVGKVAFAAQASPSLHTAGARLTDRLSKRCRHRQTRPAQGFPQLTASLKLYKYYKFF